METGHGITWSNESLADLEAIFGDLTKADAAIRTVDWRLAHDALGRGMWPLLPNSDIRLTWLRPHRGYPAIALSYRIVKDRRGPQCLMLRVRRANVPTSS